MIARLAYIAISGLGAAVAIGAMVQIRALTQRMAELKRSRALMARHMASLEELCEDEDVPENLKVSLLHLSKAFDNKHFVLSLASDLQNARAIDAGAKTFANAFQHLSADARDLLSISFRSGLTGAILRWKETAPCYQAVADGLAQGSESAEVRRAIWESERYETGRTREPQPVHA